MINQQQKVIMKKDIRGITENRRYFSVVTILPLLFSVIFPSLMILTSVLTPANSHNYEELVRILPGFQTMGEAELSFSLIGFMINNIIPIFFLIIPIMTATVMAASSFVGEKEKRTLETLFYSPLSIREIFQAKVYSSFIVGMLITYLSFFLMVIVVEIEVFLFKGRLIPLNSNWIWILLLIVPAITIIAIVLIVRGSAKSTTIEEAQQKAAFLIIPLMLLVIGQFSGVLVFGGWLVIGLGILLLLIAGLLLRFAMKGFTYERLLD